MPKSLSLLGNRQHAQDVMQETNLLLWRKANQYQSGTNFPAWMMKVAYFQVLAYRRKLNRQAIFIADEDALANFAEEALEAKHFIEERRDLFRQCQSKLPERQRDLVRRRYTEGAAIKAVAEQIGSSVAATKQALFRARENLIRCVRSSRPSNSM